VVKELLSLFSRLSESARPSAKEKRSLEREKNGGQKEVGGKGGRDARVKTREGRGESVAPAEKITEKIIAKVKKGK